MSIRCGHCQEYHENVADVRACSAGHPTTADPEPPEHPWRAAPKVEPGLYENEAGIYKVKRSKGTDRLWAQKLVIVKKDGKDRPKWEYSPSTVYLLNGSDRMTQEQAAKFGLQYSICVNCFQELEHPESVRRGYGPTCADNRGWEYDHSATE